MLRLVLAAWQMQLQQRMDELSAAAAATTRLTFDIPASLDFSNPKTSHVHPTGLAHTLPVCTLA